MNADQLRERFPALTKDIPDAECEALLTALNPRGHAAGDCLTTWGEPSNELHLVLSGALSIHVEKDGEDLILGQAGAGAVVGEVGFIEPGPSSATMQVLEPAETLAMSHDQSKVLHF